MAIRDVGAVFAVFAILGVVLVSAVQVTTSLGTVTGIQEYGWNVFRGIPFAEPPVGSNRWAPPRPASAWYPNILDATRFRGDCPQTGNYSSSAFTLDEDCLYLNIYTPQLVTEPLPVLFFIYGGGWVQGMASDSLYWANFLANSTGTIVVTANYRLGALGFLVTPEHAGNYALQDQRAALQWVHDNIAAFGGDTQRITLMGQSAGAISVSVHLTSPRTPFGFFHRAIMQSDPFVASFRTVSEMQTCTRLFAAVIGCDAGPTAPVDLQCLRSKSWADIVAAQGKAICFPQDPIYTGAGMTWQPTIDGDLVVDQPRNLLARGSFARMPILLGTVMNETTSFVYTPLQKPLPDYGYAALLDAMFGTRAPQVSAQYGTAGAGGDARPTLAQLLTDYVFVCATRQAARAMTTASNPPSRVYLYSMQHAPQLDPINNTPECRAVGACHGADLAYVFNSAAMAGAYYTPPEQQLALAMMRAWAEFAATGAVTGWQTYDAVADRSMALVTPTPVVQSGYRAEWCDFWDKLFPQAKDHL